MDQPAKLRDAQTDLDDAHHDSTTARVLEALADAQGRTQGGGPRTLQEREAANSRQPGASYDNGEMTSQAEQRSSPRDGFASDLTQATMDERVLTYWRERLAGPLPVLQLPHDRPRAREFTRMGATHAWQLPASTASALQSLAQAEQVSLPVLLLAAFYALLHRYTAQSDLLVGLQLPARADIDTVVIRCSVDPRDRFEQVLAQVGAHVSAALAHGSVPFARLLSELEPVLDPSVTPVFQALFHFREASGGVAEDPAGESSDAQTDLSVFVVQHESALAGRFVYSRDLFDATTIAQLADGFVALLAHVAEAPRTELARLRVMTDNARDRQLVTYNATEADFPLEQTVVALFAERVARQPDRLAVMGRGLTRSYAELLAEVHQLSHVLVSQGAGPNVGVAVFLERGPRLVSSLLAVLHAGSYYIPLDPSHPPERNQRILETARPKLTLMEAATRAALPAQHEGQRVDLDQLAATPHASGSAVCFEDRARAEHPAYVIFTSGSTGDPKGVAVPHRALTNFLCSMALRPGMSEQDVLLSLTTISFDIAGLELYLPLITGACVDVAERELALDPQALARHLSARGITVFQATPATFRMLVEDGWQGQPGLKVLCGGEAFPPELARALFPRVGSVWNMYGPTETTVWSSLDQLHADDPVISIGQPIHNTQLYVLNEALEPVPQGCAGMLYIGGSGVALGYFNRPDLTSAAFLPDPFSAIPGARIYRTGDLARRLRDGRLECLGRTDFQVKIRGYRIELGEIEAALLSFAGVRQAVVHVKSGPSAEKKLVGYMVFDDQRTELPVSLVEHLQSKLPHYMVPSAFVALPAFPLTPNGKVDRKALPEPLTGLRPATQSAPLRDDIEVKVADIFRSFLTLDEVPSDVSFFDLGGHSLIAARVTRELSATFDLALSAGTIFEKPTVQGLAEVIRKRGGALGPAVIPLHNGIGNAPLFFICGVHLYQSLARNLGNAQPSYGVWVPAEETFVQQAATGGQSFEELAAHYVQTIRQHTPHGPYFLAGVSFGGLLAFEVARQLRALGEDVPALVLLDSVLPEAITSNRTAWVAFQLSKLRQLGPRPLLHAALARLAKQAFAETPSDDRKRRDAELWRAITGPSCTRYLRAQPTYDGPALIVRASYRAVADGANVAPELGWAGKLRGLVQIVDVPGDHLGILTLLETAYVMQQFLASFSPRASELPAARS